MALTTIAMTEEVKEKFDRFTADWGRFMETQSDVVSRMIEYIDASELQKALSEIEKGVKERKK